MSYDRRCEELAEYFLNCERYAPEEVRALAQEIQDAVERHLESRRVSQGDGVTKRPTERPPAHETGAEDGNT
jgi:hypothetical protein